MKIIRSLKEFDFEEIWALLYDSQQNAAYPVGAIWGRGHLEIEIEKALCLGALIEGALAALIFYRKSIDGIEISWLATATQHQQKGIMKGLLSRLVNDLGSGEQLWLEVHSENQPALALYNSLGLKAQGFRKNYYSDGGGAQLLVYKPLQ